jgi:hypothetical protein
MSNDIRVFLGARLAADEQIANGAGAGHWYTRALQVNIVVDELDSPRGAADCFGRDTAIHIARHDPARVLAEVVARRRRLERHRPKVTEYYDRHGKIATFTACEICGNGGTTDDAWPCVELLDDAAPFAGHEDYDEGWRT